MVTYRRGFTPCQHLRPSSGRRWQNIQTMLYSFRQVARDLLNTSSRTDTAGRTKAFIYPVAQTRLDVPRPLFTQSHRHGWTYQGLYFPSRTDTAGRTKAFIYPVAQTRLDVPRPLFTQSHRHGWTYQGLYLPSRTDTAGRTKAFIYPVAQTRLDTEAVPLPSQNKNVRM